MKKLLSLLLALLLATSLSAGSVFGFDGNTANADTTSASDIANDIQCSSPNAGGALQQQIAQLLRQGASSAIGGALGNSEIGSVLSRALGGGSGGGGDIFANIGQDLSSSGGAAIGQGVGNAVTNACGDSQICGTIGSAVGNYVEGAAGSLISDGLSSLGVGSGGGILGSLGGSLGSVGGIASGILGGGNVPVEASKTDSKIDQTNALSTSIKALTTRIQTSTYAQEIDLCTNKPLTSKLVAAAIKKNASNTLKAIQKDNLIIEDYGQYITKAGDDAETQQVDAVVNSKAVPERYKAQVRAALTQQITKEQSGGTAANANCGTGVMTLVNFGKAGCGDLEKALTQSFSDLKQARSNAQKIAAAEAQNSGYLPKKEPCPEGTSVADCPSGSKITVPKDTVEKGAYDAASAAQNRLNSTFDTGTVVDGFFSDLFTQVLSGIGGLSGLSNNRRSGSGSSSYLDQLAGQTQAVSVTQGQGFVTTNISDSIAIEQNYVLVLRQIITSLTNTSGVFSELHSCYAALANGTPASITHDEILSRANNASTTVSSVFAPQITARNTELTRALRGIDQLTLLLQNSQTGGTATDVNAIAENFQALSDAGFVHTSGELQFLTDDMNANAAALQVVKGDAATQLVECRAIH